MYVGYFKLTSIFLLMIAMAGFIVNGLYPTATNPVKANDLPLPLPTTAAPLISGSSPAIVNPCMGQFSDVAKTDYFCAALNYMVTNGYVSGYGDGTFRPYNNVTRGQLTKIAVNTFQLTYNIPPGLQDFTDVPPAAPFYTYIEIAVHQPNPVVSGYTGSDCTNNGAVSPCFLPNSDVTRGQMIKIATNAAGYTDDVTGRAPTFYDVPSSNAFFPFVERAVIHNIISQFPPAAPSVPVCLSSTSPCFFAYTSAPRADAVIHIYNAYFHTPGSISEYEQVFATKRAPLPPTPSTQFDGVFARVSTPDPNVSGDQWAVAPVAVTDRWNYWYVESGPKKQCGLWCEYHPFWAWSDEFGVYSGWDSNTNLSPGGQYSYKSYYTGANGQWDIYFCSGAGCSRLKTTRAIETSLPFVAIGGETDYLDLRFGSVSSDSAQYRNNGVWYNWCYDRDAVPWLSRHGAISSCSSVPYPYSWLVQD